ncbi:MAG: hypothetical protein WAU02_00180 [Candidatus Saccharimonadales bacterium]
MTTDEITDLKQFIEATISQQLSLHLEDMATSSEIIDVKYRLSEQDVKLDEILNTVGESLQHHDVRLDDHDSRLRTLEHKPA